MCLLKFEVRVKTLFMSPRVQVCFDPFLLQEVACWCRVDAELMLSWCWYFQKTWRSVVEKAKWLWAAFTEEIFVMWSKSASLILFILINLYVSVCSRPRMSTTIIERYKSLAFEWNPFVLVGSPSAGRVSVCGHMSKGMQQRGWCRICFTVVETWICTKAELLTCICWSDLLDLWVMYDPCHPLWILCGLLAISASNCCGYFLSL